MTPRWFASLPNFITIARLVLTPAAIMMIAEERWRIAFLIFMVAGVSDAVDGWLAKTFSLQSELGAVLDPLADKALIISIFVTLAVIGQAPVWLAVLIVARDTLILGGVGVSWFMGRPIAVRPHFISKVTTAAQLVLAALILSGEAYGFRNQALETLLVAGVAALTIASASVYLRVWVQHMRP
jgi:cardiolipin synthase (CMP-forming)